MIDPSHTGLGGGVIDDEDVSISFEHQEGS